MCVFVVGSLALRIGTHTGDGPVQGEANETTSRTLQHRDYTDVESRAEDRLVAAALRRMADSPRKSASQGIGQGSEESKQSLARAGSTAKAVYLPTTSADGGRVQHDIRDSNVEVLSSTPSPSEEHWRALLAPYTDWDVEVMLRIIACESHGDKNAISPDGRNWGGMQINVVNYPSDPYDLLMPAVNVAVGHSVWLRQGYTAWACYAQ